MTERDYQGRIAELERALEDVLECFDANIDGYSIDTENWDAAQVDPDIAEIIEGAGYILWGGANYAEEE